MGHPEQARGCLRQVWGSLAVEVGHEAQFAGGAGQSQGAERLVVHVEQRGNRVQDARCVQGSHQGKVPAGGVGESGDGPTGVGRGVLAHGEDCSARPDRDDDVTAACPDAEGGCRVVPGSRADDDALGCVADRLPYPGDARQQGVVSEGGREQLVIPGVVRRAPVPGAGGV